MLYDTDIWTYRDILELAFALAFNLFDSVDTPSRLSAAERRKSLAIATAIRSAQFLGQVFKILHVADLL